MQAKPLSQMDNEEKWQANLEGLQAYFNQGGTLPIPRDLACETTGTHLNDWLKHQRSRDKTGDLSPSQRDRLIALGLSLDPIESDWQDAYQTLTSFLAEGQIHSIPSSLKSKKNRISISRWLTLQRHNLKHGKLSDAHYRLLSPLGAFGDSFFHEALTHLTTFHNTEGHSNVPFAYQTPCGFKLGYWVSNTRRRYAQLSEGQQAQLSQLDFTLTAEDIQWELGLASLRQQHQIGGVDIKIPASFRFTVWQETIRKAYREKRLRFGQLRELVAHQFVFNKHDALWNKMFLLLTTYREKEGHVNVPYRFKCEDGTTLGQWVSMQKKKAKQGKLTRKQSGKLRCIGVEIGE